MIKVSKEGRKTIRLQLTPDGRGKAKELAARPSFSPLVSRLKELKKVFGGKSGSSLKKLIYEIFEIEVGQRQYGEVIRK